MPAGVLRRRRDVTKRDGWHRIPNRVIPLHIYYRDGYAVGEVWKATRWYWCHYGTGREGEARLLRDAKAKLLVALEVNDGQA
jgi:hypothetical protein